LVGDLLDGVTRFEGWGDDMILPPVTVALNGDFFVVAACLNTTEARKLRYVAIRR